MYLVQTENTNNTNVGPVTLTIVHNGILLGGWPSHRPIGLNMARSKWRVSTPFTIIGRDRPMSLIWLGRDSIWCWPALLGGFQVIQDLEKCNFCFRLVPGI